MEDRGEMKETEVCKINKGKQKWMKKKQSEGLEELPTGLAWLSILSTGWFLQHWGTELMKCLSTKPAIILMKTLVKCYEIANYVV